MATSQFDTAVERAAQDIKDEAILSRVKFWIREFDLGRGNLKSWASNSALRKVERVIEWMQDEYEKTGIVHRQLLSHEEILALRYYSPYGDLSPKVVGGLLKLDLNAWMSHKTLTAVTPTRTDLQDIEARIESVIQSKGFATQEPVETIAKRLDKDKKVSEQICRLRTTLEEQCGENVEKQLKPYLKSLGDIETIKNTVQAMTKTTEDHVSDIKNRLNKFEKDIVDLRSRTANTEDRRAGEYRESYNQSPGPRAPATPTGPAGPRGYRAFNPDPYRNRNATAPPPFLNDHRRPRWEDNREGGEYRNKRQSPVGGFVMDERHDKRQRM